MANKLLLLFFYVFVARLVSAEVVKITLIIGNNHGFHTDAPLKYAIRDAERTYRVFAQIGEIQNDRNYLLLNQKKQKILDTMNEIKGRIQELKNNQKEVFIYVYYSGHADPRTLHVEGEKLSMETLKIFFSSINADLRIMIVDACYSGALLREKGVELGSPVKINTNNKLTTKGSAIITSSSSRELSFESDELQGSLFTNHWVTGLRGAADLNHDKVITLLEVYNYAQLQTKKSTHTKKAAQSPGFDFDLVGSKDIVLTRLEQGKSFIQFKNCDGEKYSVISVDRQEIIAIVQTLPKDSVTLVVPRGNYLIQKKTDKYLYVSKIDLYWQDNFIFHPGQMSVYPLGTLKRKGALNWRFYTHQLLLETKFLRDIPTSSRWMLIPGVKLRYHYKKYKINFSFGYGNDNLNSDILNVERSYLNTVFGIYKTLRNNYFYNLDLGIELGALFIRQKLSRKNERSIQLANYSALPRHNALALQIGLTTNNTLVFKHNILLTVTLGVSAFTYREFMARKYVLRFPFTVGIGKRF